MNIFEYAIKNKLRYTTNHTVGLITTEDLYSLPLDSTHKISLNSVAKEVNRELKNCQEESFVTAATEGNTLASIKLEVVKFVIAERLKEAEAKKTLKDIQAKKAAIADIIVDKQNDALKSMSIEELQAELVK